MGKFIKDDGADISTPVGRFSWCYIFSEDPKQKPKDDQKYKVTLMLPKNKKALASLGLNPKQEAAVLKDVEVFVKETKEFAAEKSRGKFGAKYKGKRWNPILDGDSDQNIAASENNANFWLIRTKSKFKPTVVDRNMNPITTDENPEGLYSGCWGRLKLGYYCYDGENAGFAFGLGFHIKKVANDEEFAGGQSAEEAFDDGVEDLDIEDADFDNDDLDDVDETEEDDELE